VHGNYFGPSNGTEVEGLRRIVERWCTDPILDAKGEGYIHDRDAKTRSLMRELWDKPEFLDRNHVLKGFDRNLEHELLPHRLKTKLWHWFIMRLKMEQTTNEKVRLWRNSVNHYQGIHMHCLPHAPDRKPPILTPKSRKKKQEHPSGPQQDTDEPCATSSTPRDRPRLRTVAPTDQTAAATTQNTENIARLENFLEQTQEFLSKLRRGINTQLCESFHARKAKLACKDIAWRVSWQARVAAAVLDMNESEWRLQLDDRLDSQTCIPWLCKSSISMNWRSLIGFKSSHNKRNG
jgi:hypothetical protein